MKSNYSNGTSRLAPRADGGELGDFGHAVQFYEDDTFLLDAVCRFIAKGLESGRGGVIVATPPHLKSLEQRLTLRGIDVAEARGQGGFVTLDAAETLSRFMVDGWPDAERFVEVVGSVIERTAHGRACVRVFGEMVALLWASGNRRAAIRLEGLWNELAKDHSFSLLCGYPLHGFDSAADVDPLFDVCTEHSRVIPAENYTSVPSADERLRVITQLQQKARALEAEIAKREEAQRILERREKELADFLENAVQGMHQVGPDGRILWANQAELDLLGYTRNEYVGRHIAEFYVDREIIDAILGKIMQGETVRDQSAQLRCKDGSIKDVLIHSNALREDGKFVHTRCFTRDVTARRRAERERDDLFARERAARAEADAANCTKDEFLGTISHELRTPLQAMLGWVRVLRTQKVDEATTSRALETIERSAKAQSQLIMDLLGVSRVISGKLRLELQMVDLLPVIELAIEVVRSAADAKRIRLERVLPMEPLRLWGDPDRLQQVVWNLLSNAVKFTPEGGRVEIALRRAGHEAEIVVKDDGQGIPPGFLPYVFDRFRQADATTTRVKGGLGLGLSIVRHLVELHGGVVRAESAGNGRGATFTVALPIPTLLPDPRAAADGPINSTRPASLQGLQVLVVDDEADARDLLAAVLRGHGAHVTTAASAVEALASLSRGRPDVIVSDIAMPDEDGYALMRRLREHHSDAGNEAPPAIALTAYARDEDRRKALAAGFHLHLAKPTDPGELLAAVARISGRVRV